jgi:hypothetical protein
VWTDPVLEPRLHGDVACKKEILQGKTLALAYLAWMQEASMFMPSAVPAPMMGGELFERSEP